MQFLRFKIAKNFILFSAVLLCSIFAYTINTQTVKAWACGDALIDSRDSKSYSTVLIGTQCWMAQNLNVGTKIAGAGNQTNNSTLEKYCYSDNEANCTTYGGLYQWDEAMQYASSCNGTGAPPNDICSSPVQGICPAGWHMPSHYEWNTLEKVVCTSGSCITDFPYNTTTAGWRGTNEGTKLKSGGSSGFNALLAGIRLDGVFALGSDAYFWTSSKSGLNAFYRNFNSNANIFRIADSTNTDSGGNGGFSIRCIKSLNTAPTITSISATPNPVKGGSTITVTPTGQTDADSNNLNLFCAESTAPTSATNICTEASTSYTSSYTTMACTYATVADNTTHTVYCRTYDGSEYSNEVTTTFVTDSTAPTITITNPNTNPAQSKTITATTSDGTLTMSNTTGAVCDASLTFTTYSSQTFISESDNTTKVCYKAQDSVGNISYSLSNAITGIDTTPPPVPTADLTGNTYDRVFQVTLTSSGATNIYYTTNNTTPTTSSTLYTTAITIESTKTLKAIAEDSVGNTSSVMTETYIVNLPQTTVITAAGNAHQVFASQPSPQASALPKTMTSEQKQILIAEIKAKIAELVRQLIIMLQRGE